MPNKSEQQYHVRQNTLTDGDVEIIKAIVESVTHNLLNNHVEKTCKFSNVSPDELSEAVKFFKNVNDTIEDSKKTVRRTILGILVLILFGLTTQGFWTKLSFKMKSIIGD